MLAGTEVETARAGSGELLFLCCASCLDSHCLQVPALRRRRCRKRRLLFVQKLIKV